MKIIIIICFLFSSMLFHTQQQNKEIVYLLFDEKSEEQCKVAVEGKGYLNVNKFRKEFQADYIYFRICDETFSTHKTKTFQDTCSIRALENLKIVNLEYINNNKSKSILKYNPFQKIFIIEKISNSKMIKHEVAWVDNWIMVDD